MAHAGFVYNLETNIKYRQAEVFPRIADDRNEHYYKTSPVIYFITPVSVL